MTSVVPALCYKLISFFTLILIIITVSWLQAISYAPLFYSTMSEPELKFLSISMHAETAYYRYITYNSGVSF